MPTNLVIAVFKSLDLYVRVPGGGEDTNRLYTRHMAKFNRISPIKDISPFQFGSCIGKNSPTAMMVVTFYTCERC